VHLAAVRANVGAVARWIGLGLLVLPAVAIGIAWGGRALVVYLVLAGISGGLAVAISLGGDWVRDTSRGRFDRDDKRR
jgi:hypothetical protein